MSVQLRLTVIVTIAILVATVGVVAQSSLPSVIFVSSDPAGSCTNGFPLEFNYVSNKLWGCANSTWTAISSGGGGSGTVNNGTANQVSYYATTGTAVSGNTGLTVDNSGNLVANKINKITLTAPVTSWTINPAADNQTTTVPGGTLVPVADVNAAGAVTKLQNVTISATTPTDRQALTYNLGTASWEPNDGSAVDPTVFIFNEEYCPSGTSTGTIGTYSWVLRNIAGTSTVVGVNPIGGFCAYRFASGATSGNGGILAIDSNGGQVFVNPSAVPAWKVWIRGKINQTTSMQWRWGLVTSGNAVAIPTTGVYWRYDTTLQNVASAVTNDAGNKGGLTTLTCNTSDTVTFSLDGGTATGSVACTGANAIANGTAITVTAAGKGYNATGGAAKGTVTGGTSAVHTGSIALTTTLGAAASGSDTNFMLCTTVASQEFCADTLIAADTNNHRVDFRYISPAMFGITFRDATGTIQTAEKTFCAAGGGCDVSVATPTGTMTFQPVIATATSVSASADLDFIKAKAVGLTK